MKMHEEKKGAAYFYHHPQFRFNCAQAIVHFFGGDADAVERMRKCGGGRANNGNCGALHGALEILKDSSWQREMVYKRFVERAGSPFCHEIRKGNAVSCKNCVEIAEAILVEMDVNPKHNTEQV